MDRFFAIVNPAAGGGRSAKLAGPALTRLREKGLRIDVIASTGQGHAVQLAREAYDQGYRHFLAVGGDGTAHEILNGVFARRPAVERIALGFLPMGTGNSFLRDFAKEGAVASLEALVEGRTRSVDLLKLTHATGEIYSFNLLSVGFTADVAALTNRMFKPFGDLGYLNEPELTAETIIDGWLQTGDLGRFDGTGHLQLAGRKKNMIVTEEGKNIYPEDVCAGARSAGWACCALCRGSMTALISNIRWLRGARCATWNSKKPRQWM